MAYAEGNPKTKKALKEAVAAGRKIGIFNPSGMFPCKDNGAEMVEGPHCPAPHTWHAQVTMKDGVIVKVR